MPEAFVLLVDKVSGVIDTENEKGKSLISPFQSDNDMVNGTKLLNVVGMSRGRRDGILKNERGRVVVKVGAMHLKGVW